MMCERGYVYWGGGGHRPASPSSNMLRLVWPRARIQEHPRIGLGRGGWRTRVVATLIFLKADGSKCSSGGCSARPLAEPLLLLT
jgi:hypothetical protein